MIDFFACLETVPFVKKIISTTKVSKVFALGLNAINAKALIIARMQHETVLSTM